MRPWFSLVSRRKNTDGHRRNVLLKPHLWLGISLKKSQRSRRFFIALPRNDLLPLGQVAALDLLQWS